MTIGDNTIREIYILLKHAETDHHNDCSIPGQCPEQVLQFPDLRQTFRLQLHHLRRKQTRLRHLRRPDHHSRFGLQHPNMAKNHPTSPHNISLSSPQPVVFFNKRQSRQHPLQHREGQSGKVIARIISQEGDSYEDVELYIPRETQIKVKKLTHSTKGNFYAFFY